MYIYMNIYIYTSFFAHQICATLLSNLGTLLQSDRQKNGTDKPVKAIFWLEPFSRLWLEPFSRPKCLKHFKQFPLLLDCHSRALPT